MKEDKKYNKPSPTGTYVPKQEKKPEKKKIAKKQSGEVIFIKASSLIVNVKGNGVSVVKTAKHKDVKVGDVIEV